MLALEEGRFAFLANVITMALRDEQSELQGYARPVRDFNQRHHRDEKLRRSRARTCAIPEYSGIFSTIADPRTILDSW